jgi:hypothetical protein
MMGVKGNGLRGQQRWLLCAMDWLVSVVAAFGVARTFLYFHLPQPFAAFASQWRSRFGMAALGRALSPLCCPCPHVFFALRSISHRIVYDVVFVIFAVLMTGDSSAR